jgi:hypothetical protein
VTNKHVLPVHRFEVAAWCRLGAVYAYDRGDRMFVPVRALRLPHDRTCGCLDCTGRVRP